MRVEGLVADGGVSGRRTRHLCELVVQDAQTGAADLVANQNYNRRVQLMP